MSATMLLNEELKGIEITFDSKPEADILDNLKSNGFRWHRQKKLWYAKDNADRRKLATDITNGIMTSATAAKKPDKKENIFGVKVGDFFSASWGYEQTNNDFFQVVELVGKQSVRVREVNPPMLSENAVSGMSADRTYNLDTSKILDPVKNSVFIKDQEKGDLKRLKKGFYADEKEALKNCYFNLSSYADARKENAETTTVYESWYY